MHLLVTCRYQYLLINILGNRKLRLVTILLLSGLHIGLKGSKLHTIHHIILSRIYVMITQIEYCMLRSALSSQNVMFERNSWCTICPNNQHVHTKSFYATISSASINGLSQLHWPMKEAQLHSTRKFCF